MGIIKGKDFMFSAMVDGQREILCHATDFTLNVSTDSLETTGPGNGRWKSYIPGLNSYTISVPALVSYTEVLNIVQLQERQYAGEMIEWFGGVNETGGLTYHGFMFITNITMTSQMRDAVKFDMSAQGTGPQDILKNPITKTVPLTDMYGVRLFGCPNPYPVGVLWYDGTFIGPANNSDDVISVFNSYAIMQGGFISLVGYIGGCDFTMQVEWNSPINPDFVPAVPASGFALRGRVANEAIGGQENTNEVISA